MTGRLLHRLGVHAGLVLVYAAGWMCAQEPIRWWSIPVGIAGSMLIWAAVPTRRPVRHDPPA